MAKSKKTASEPALGYEAKLWQMAGTSRNSMNAADFKYFVLGFISLKYLSDLFRAMHAVFASQVGVGADPEYPDEYRAASIYAPPDAVLSL